VILPAQAQQVQAQQVQARQAQAQSVQQVQVQVQSVQQVQVQVQLARAPLRRSPAELQLHSLEQSRSRPLRAAVAPNRTS